MQHSFSSCKYLIYNISFRLQIVAISNIIFPLPIAAICSVPHIQMDPPCNIILQITAICYILHLQISCSLSLTNLYNLQHHLAISTSFPLAVNYSLQHHPRAAGYNLQHSLPLANGIHPASYLAIDINLQHYQAG